MSKTNIKDALDTALLPLIQCGNIQRLYVGLSGGIDSVVLLFLCKQFVEYHHSSVELHGIHVNHGLSEFADQWQQHVEGLCEAWSIPLVSHRVELEQKGSIEEVARNARYDAFKRSLDDQDVLVLGHHQDDQVETMMQRLMRGSGLSGLLSMNVARTLDLGNNKQAIILRPLLSTTKKQIEQYANDHQLKYVQDDSNLDTQFDRNFWRLQVLPLIENRYPQYRQSVQASLNALQEEQSCLQFFLQQALEKVLLSDASLAISVLQQYPKFIQQQIIRYWLQFNEIFPLPTQSQLDTIFDEVIAAREDAEPRFHWQTHSLARYRNGLFLLNDSLFPVDHNDLPEVWRGELLDLSFVLLQQSPAKETGLKPDQYKIVWGNPGQSIRPLGRPSKTYKKLMQEANIPPWQRPHWPVLTARGQVAAVPGICVCEGFSQVKGWQIQLKFKLNKK
ncbi:tRNA lysidine(34) synthetase TilS [Bermanella marisrubri]|uniref:tRNA(Ile)-lysidine synthase n=1 Tax=Bermanella marisrubri TaxID=207949 RepID=Q1MY96_9GAMM|nr:tRNA lysidine(34) synthetase TilS [Bermanella marisrubri]EAT10971.1 Cell cycle protein MesJ [Oceanobacter sp. RED65] [Bermanella marisrubri]QIZ85118.1 tRNA lysidine(34) synthetase TilS [Bermanella marisrubri]